MVYHVVVSATAIVSNVVEVEANTEQEAIELAIESNDEWFFDAADGIEDVIGGHIEN